MPWRRLSAAYLSSVRLARERLELGGRLRGCADRARPVVDVPGIDVDAEDAAGMLLPARSAGARSAAAAGAAASAPRSSVCLAGSASTASSSSVAPQVSVFSANERACRRASTVGRSCRHADLNPSPIGGYARRLRPPDPRAVSPDHAAPVAVGRCGAHARLTMTVQCDHRAKPATSR